MDLPLKEVIELVYDLIKDIKDPEKPETLEELSVVNEEDISALRIEAGMCIKIEFTPTVPHCSLATLIGLCIRIKLQRNLPWKHKVDICIKDGTHDTGPEVNKQINDKERVSAAMENPNLRDIVEQCIGDDHLV